MGKRYTPVPDADLEFPAYDEDSDLVAAGVSDYGYMPPPDDDDQWSSPHHTLSC